MPSDSTLWMAPLLLRRMNFFLEFDVCFYRSQLAFEVRPKT